MKDGITRRRFISTGAAVGATVTLGGGLFDQMVAPVSAGEAEAAGLMAVTGPDGFKNTNAAVEGLGGISQFVPKGASVVINANTAFKHRGSIVDPNVLLATLTLVAEAGAGDVWLIKPVKEDYWKHCDRAAEYLGVIDAAKVSEREFKTVKIAKGVALTEAQVDRHLLSADVYINLSIAKNHQGCQFTGALKNTMGACPHDPTCKFFHVGSKPDSDDWYPDLGHLSQCVADLNLVRQPDLCILDAGEILVSNGPFGPGELATPHAVVAGSDIVAVDAFGVRYLGLEPDAVAMIELAENHGLGTTDLAKIGVREVALS